MRSRAQSYRTLDGLNADCQNIAWYWKLVAFVSSYVLLGGFLILPATFDSDTQFRVSQPALGIFSVALLAIGFSATGLVCFACRNPIFQANNVFLPNIASCAIGLLTVVYSFVISKRYYWNVPAFLVTIGSGFSFVIYALLFLLAHRSIAAVHRNGERVTPLVPRSSVQGPGVTYHDPNYFENHLANMYPASQSQAPAPYNQPEELTEDDLLRQQMRMLLAQKQDHHLSTASSTNTFNRIEFDPVDEPEPPSISVAPPDSYIHHASSVSGHSSQNSWGGNSAQPWDGVWRSAPTPSASIREQRRREIEQGR